ncbi:MAG: 3-dehydroquinate synthase [Eubacteriales bacterium]
MKTTIDAGSYKIVVEKNSLDSFGEQVKNELGVCRALIVSDDRIHSLYGERTRKSLIDAGFDLAEDFVFPHGEKSKCLGVLEQIVRHAAQEKLTRRDMIIALGGGVTGDMAGFASAVYLRGIRYASVPTSLLSMVDSSVGGKTAVDIPEGKNLVGAFHQPSFVLSDTELLKTLPDEYLYDGMAEVIKYGVLGNADLFELLEKSDSLHDDIDDIVCACVRDKRDIVSRDFTDKGERQKLNLGHTIGHSIELLSDFGISHGHAVASGMYLITKCAVSGGLCDEKALARLETVLKKYSLDPFIYTKFDLDSLVEAASHDKKMSGDKITLVVPKKIGECELCKMDFVDLKKFVAVGF